MDLSVVIPIYNEQENLPVLYERLTDALGAVDINYEIIFVNDGSADNSLKMIKEYAAKDHHIRFVDFSRNFGHQIAIYAGMEQTCGEHIIFMDGDLQDPPELLPELLKKAKEGYEVVYAVRKNRQGVGIFKKTAYSVFYRILGAITDIEIPLDTGDFRIIHRKIVEVIRQMPEQPKFLRGQIAWVGFKQTSLEYQRPERLAGEPGYTFAKLVQLALDGITGFSTVPLKLATIMGFIVSGFAFLIALYTIFAKFFSPDYLQGWASTMVSILFLGGIQLISVGIIGEYISRLTSNVQNRPLYIIRETNVEKSEDQQTNSQQQ